jgi:hypothetical protein
MSYGFAEESAMCILLPLLAGPEKWI